MVLFFFFWKIILKIWLNYLMFVFRNLMTLKLISFTHDYMNARAIAESTTLPTTTTVREFKNLNLKQIFKLIEYLILFRKQMLYHNNKMSRKQKITQHYRQINTISSITSGKTRKIASILLLYVFICVFRFCFYPPLYMAGPIQTYQFYYIFCVFTIIIIIKKRFNNAVSCMTSSHQLPSFRPIFYYAIR